MNNEEFKECSVVAYPRQIKFLHINGGAISYYVDRHVSDYVDRLQQENQELKKQLHEASIGIQELIEQDIECPSNCSKLKEILNQQKEFIEYLTSYIDLLSNKPDLIEEAEIDILEEILSKYKSIIGGKE